MSVSSFSLLCGSGSKTVLRNPLGSQPCMGARFFFLKMPHLLFDSWYRTYPDQGQRGEERQARVCRPPLSAIISRITSPGSASARSGAPCRWYQGLNYCQEILLDRTSFVTIQMRIGILLLASCHHTWDINKIPVFWVRVVSKGIRIQQFTAMRVQIRIRFCNIIFFIIR